MPPCGAVRGASGRPAAHTDRAAVQRRRRPKTCKLVASPRLHTPVVTKLAQRWSPEQIAGWLKRTHPGRPELQVSHETIYRSLFIQSRGALKHELTAHLRTRRGVRRPGNAKARGSGKGQLVGTVHISQRPGEANDPAVPGRWEGDLVLGRGKSAIGTLVERSTRFTMLFHLDGITSAKVLAALTRQIHTLPDQLARSVTWDQGKEMARHATYTSDTGIQIYFCDQDYLAAWHQREHRRAAAPIPPAADRPHALHPGRLGPRRGGAQRPTARR